MADTSIVSREELEAIASASGFAVWELEQVVSDSNFRFLRDELRAGMLGVVVNPEQALQAPSPIGELVQAGAEGAERITDALKEKLPKLGKFLKELRAQVVVVAVALAIIVLVFRFGGRR